jgi:hypothetical protein
MTNRDEQGDWQHLKPYGYAPGGYMAKCYGCEKVVEFVDKRATRCRPCAEALHIRAQQASTQPEQAQEAIPEELVCPECDEGFVLGSRVWLACSKCHGSGRTDRLGDCVPGTRRKKDKAEAETSATASVAGLSAAAPAVASSAMEAIRRYAWDFAQHAIHHTDSTKAAADRSLAVVNVTLTTHREHPAAQQERQEVLLDGATIYTLNARGANRWSAWVQPGQDDEGNRISDAECERIAAALAAQAQKGITPPEGASE